MPYDTNHTSYGLWRACCFGLDSHLHARTTWKESSAGGIPSSQLNCNAQARLLTSTCHPGLTDPALKLDPLPIAVSFTAGHLSHLQHGVCHAGKKANPLEDLPRWRVESLVGTFVLDMSLYRRALTAPSAVPDSITASYERLEYLGDGILEGIIRQFIYSRCGRFWASCACFHGHAPEAAQGVHACRANVLPYKIARRGHACSCGTGSWRRVRQAMCAVVSSMAIWQTLL